MTRNLTGWQAWGRQAGRQAGFQISYASDFLQWDLVALLLIGLSGLSQGSHKALRTLITTVYVKTNVLVFSKFPEPESKIQGLGELGALRYNTYTS